MANINVRRYEGIWDENADFVDIINGYTEEYANLKDVPVDALAGYYKKLSFKDSQGGFSDFKCEGKSLKDVMIEDFINELKLEFPENFS